MMALSLAETPSRIKNSHMGALTGGDHGFRVRFIHLRTDRRKRPSVDYHFARIVLFLPVSTSRTIAPAKTFLLDQRDHAHVISRGAAQIKNRLCKVHRQPRIIELPVVVRTPRCKPGGFERWDAFSAFLHAREPPMA